MNRRKEIPVFFKRFHVRRNHKDALFIKLFGSKENLLSLYNALNHSNYTNADAFEQGEGCLEVVATMYNINLGHNRELMEQCKLLGEYATFIALIRRYEDQDMPIEMAVDEACRECISKGVLKSFLLKNRSEVTQMFMADYDPKRQRKLDRRDAYNDGKIEGKIESKAEDILELLNDLGSVPEQLEEQIKKEKDLEVLTKLHKKAAKADSVEQFFKEYKEERMLLTHEK